MKTYSFSDVIVTLSHADMGETISVNGLGIGTITYTMTEDRTTGQVASDGTVIMNKIKNRMGTAALAVQQTSDLNKKLLRWYNYLEAAATSQWAEIVLIIKSKQTNELITGTGGAFLKLPEEGWNKEAADMTWNFIFADMQKDSI